jgi:hypothetical protein
MHLSAKRTIDSFSHQYRGLRVDRHELCGTAIDDIKDSLEPAAIVRSQRGAKTA